MKADFNIADISVSIEGDLPRCCRDAMEPYVSHALGEAQLRIRCSVARHIAAKKPDRVYGIRHFIEEYSSLGDNFLSQDISGEDALAVLSYSRDFSRVDFSLVDVEQDGGSDISSRISVGLGKSVLNCLPAFGGITFHSSAIAYKGSAVLFAAPSGTGKSSQSALWRKFYPEETSYINDDTPIIRKKDGRFFAYGSPWAGTSGINSNISAPIRAIVYVERSTVNSVRRLDGTEKLLRILRSVREQVFPPQRERQNKLIFELTADVPAYELCCDLSQGAVETLKSLLF